MQTKIIFTLILLFGLTNLSQAQTKEETIAWIKEKIQKYPVLENEVIKINECEIIIKQYLIKGSKALYDEITMPTDLKGCGYDNLVFKSKVVKYWSPDTNEIEYKDNVSFFVAFSREDDLGERFLKALQHLHTFCEKKKETF